MQHENDSHSSFIITHLNLALRLSRTGEGTQGGLGSELGLHSDSAAVCVCELCFVFSLSLSALLCSGVAWPHKFGSMGKTSELSNYNIIFNFAVYVVN